MEKNIKKIVEDIELMTKFKTGAWVVRSNDKTLTLSSGKSVWKAENHAKSALANHFEHMYSRNSNLVKEWGFKDTLEISHYMQNSGIIKVEQL